MPLMSAGVWYLRSHRAITSCPLASENFNCYTVPLGICYGVRRASRLSVVECQNQTAMIDHPLVSFLVGSHRKCRTDSLNYIRIRQDSMISFLPFSVPSHLKVWMWKGADQMNVPMYSPLLQYKLCRPDIHTSGHPGNERPVSIDVGLLDGCLQRLDCFPLRTAQLFRSVACKAASSFPLLYLCETPRLHNITALFRVYYSPIYTTSKQFVGAYLNGKIHTERCDYYGHIGTASEIA